MNWNEKQQRTFLHLFFIVKETVAYSSKITFASNLSLYQCYSNKIKTQQLILQRLFLFYT